MNQKKLTQAQLECLSSLVRVDLYEAIQKCDGASIAELAKELNKSPQSLYYHMRQLSSAKLIRIREYRRVAKRDEAIYEVVSKRLLINKRDTSRKYSEAVVKTVGSALRKADREHRAARLRSSDPTKFAVSRVQARLKAKDAKRLREQIVELTQWIREQSISNDEIQTEEISFTCLVVPLDSQNQS